jgi:putative ABC transport system permease protein
VKRPLHRRLLPPGVGDQFDDELAAHLEMLVDQYVASGIPPAEARGKALARIGDLAAARAECVAIGGRTERRTTHRRLWEQLRQDLSIGVRSLTRQKGWTAIALVTLALGIGASTAVFSAINSLLLHPVPYPDPDRVVLIFETSRNSNSMALTIAAPTDAMRTWRGHALSFSAIEPFGLYDVTLLAGAEPVVAHAAMITPSFVTFAGGRVLRGRNFIAADTIPGAPAVALLGEGTWRTRYGSDTSIIGRTISVDGVSRTVVGVMPRSLQLIAAVTSVPDIWLPLMGNDASFALSAMGRLRPGVTIPAAERELDTLATVGQAPSATEFRAQLNRPVEMVNSRDSLLLLAVAVGLVLLIACVNVAHLLLARGAARARELAIRAALGAGRGRLFRQLVTESLLLSGAGCIAGLALGWLGLLVMIAARPTGLAELAAAKMDSTVVLAAIALSLCTGLIFGLVGATQFAMQSPHASLKAGAPSGSGTRGQHRLRSLLVVTEMAIAAMLLVGATLLIRSMVHLQSIDVGFEAENLYAVGFPGSNHDATPNLVAEIVAQIRLIPGVREVALSQSAPPNMAGRFGALEAEGNTTIPPAGFVEFNGVRPGYFRFMRLPIIAGGTFTDSSGHSQQILVNQGMARKYWPGHSAVGQRMRFDASAPWLTVVGVVADAALGGATSDRSSPIVYVPGPNIKRPTFLVRTAEGVNPMTAIRTLFTTLTPHDPPPVLKSVALDMDRDLARPRFTMLLLTIFTVMAVILSAVGLYGVLAFAVTQRTREIGIRMALGAGRADVVRRIAGAGLLMAGVGAVAGLIGARFATALIASMLYGVPPTDLLSFAIGIIILLATALLACVVPARRAVAIDPMVAIRAD